MNAVWGLQDLIQEAFCSKQIDRVTGTLAFLQGLHNRLRFEDIAAQAVHTPIFQTRIQTLLEGKAISGASCAPSVSLLHFLQS